MCLVMSYTAPDASSTRAASGTTFLSAALLRAAPRVAAWVLPRRHEESHLLDDESDPAAAPPVVLH